MELNDSHRQLILKYIDGDLSSEESEEFEQLRKQSIEFQKEVDNMVTVASAIKAEKRLQEYKEVEAIFEEFRQGESVKIRLLQKQEKDSGAVDDSSSSYSKKNKSILIWGMGIAASLTLIFVVLYVALIKTAELTSEQIYATYFEPFPYDNSRKENAIPDAFALYNSGKYEESVTALQGMVNDTTQKFVDIYLSNALLQSGQTTFAISTLESLKINKNNQFLWQYRTWYLGLAYLKNRQIEKALIEFKLLNTPGSIYERKAQAIIKDIEQMSKE